MEVGISEKDALHSWTDKPMTTSARKHRQTSSQTSRQSLNHAMRPLCVQVPQASRCTSTAHCRKLHIRRDKLLAAVPQFLCNAWRAPSELGLGRHRQTGTDPPTAGNLASIWRVCKPYQACGSLFGCVETQHPRLPLDLLRGHGEALGSAPGQRIPNNERRRGTGIYGVHRHAVARGQLAAGEFVREEDVACLGGCVGPSPRVVPLLPI
mmetsp:Transcript_14019/g.49369  ORF Transcript_14019/g.49369 Transcript_14019/m.49369 type:complete len:209 (+) Transcript_14019:78-704(+)